MNNIKIQPNVDKYETFKTGIKEAIKSIYEKPPKSTYIEMLARAPDLTKLFLSAKIVNTARIICIYQSQDSECPYIDSDGAELNFSEFVQASLSEAQNEIQNKYVTVSISMPLNNRRDD